MEHSSGIILYKKEGDKTLFFVCTPGGPYWEHKELWSFPKGHIEYGETPLEAAIREFEEETSIKLSTDSAYKYLGTVRQNRNKKVSVFAKRYDGEDTNNCKSIVNSIKINGKHVTYNEIKDYCWMTIDELSEKGIKCYIDKYKMLICDD